MEANRKSRKLFPFVKMVEKLGDGPIHLNRMKNIAFLSKCEMCIGFSPREISVIHMAYLLFYVFILLVYWCKFVLEFFLFFLLLYLL